MIPRESNDKLCDFGRRWRLDGDYLRCVGCARAEGKRPNAATCQVGRPMLASCDGQPFKHADGCKQATELHPWAELRTLLAEPAPADDAALIAILEAEGVSLMRFDRPDGKGEVFTTSGSQDVANLLAAMRRAIAARAPTDLGEDVSAVMRRARAEGKVVTIELLPHHPPAMGAYSMAYELRDARQRSPA